MALGRERLRIFFSLYLSTAAARCSGVYLSGSASRERTGTEDRSEHTELSEGSGALPARMLTKHDTSSRSIDEDIGLATERVFGGMAVAGESAATLQPRQVMSGTGG